MDKFADKKHLKKRVKINLDDLLKDTAIVWKDIEEVDGKYMIGSNGNIYGKNSRCIREPYVDSRWKGYSRRQINLLGNDGQLCFDVDLLLIKYFPDLYKRATVEDLEGEIWKPVSGFENAYHVSNKGRLKGFHPKGEYLYRLVDNKGYGLVMLHKNGRKRGVCVHILVAEAFIPNLNNLPEVNHIDFNPMNNQVSNLEWCTHKYNIEHSAKHGRMTRGEKHHNTTLTEDQVREIKRDYVYGTGRKLSEKFKVDISTIHNIVNQKVWKHVS